MTKKIGLSLVAAAVLATPNAMAFDDTKVTGGVKLWYQTTSQDKDSFGGDGASFFERAGSIGDLVTNVGITSKANDHIGVGIKAYAATTLGLENEVVSNETLNNATSGGAHHGAVLNGEANEPFWIGEAYMTYSAGNNIVKVGRQELDTPLAFTEKWNAAPNTFEATALINQSLPDTTIVAAYVSRGNGHANGYTANSKTVLPSFESYWEGVADQFAYDNDVDANSDGVGDTTGAVNNANVTNTVDAGGAFALGILNKSAASVPVNFWYYSVRDTATAMWVDADVKAGAFGVKLVGASVAPAGATDDLLATDSETTTAMAAKVSGNFGGIGAYAAFSSISEGNLPVANTATGFKKTKLPTASIFSDGLYAAQPDSTSIKIGASMKVGEVSSLSASYGSYAFGKNGASATKSAHTVIGSGSMTGSDKTTTEIDVVYKTKLSDINLAAMYINQASYAIKSGKEVDRSYIRVVAGIDF